MSDLCAPVYVVTGADEELTFWCFVEIMNRMVLRYPDRSSLLSAHASLIYAESELSTGPERDEEAAFDTSAAHRRDGPRAVPTSGFVSLLTIIIWYRPLTDCLGVQQRKPSL
jgi:hypothetical protein